MGCLHCRGKVSKEEHPRGQDMPFEMVKKAIDFAVDNAENNFLEIVVSGGEPLLHSDLEKILEYCDARGQCHQLNM